MKIISYLPEKIKKKIILNYFINSPTLKVNSDKYPFDNFHFTEEVNCDNDFSLSSNLIIGKQAESYFEACLKRSKSYDLLASNIQIQDTNATIGELDYIIRDLNLKKLIHIELACKFYLYDSNINASEESKWVGPNRKDSLYEKLEKVKRKQFPLLHHNKTVQRLRELNIEIPNAQELCLKAFLFIPKGENRQKFPANYQKCLVGYWIKHKDFYKEDKAALYVIPHKKEWLLPPKQIEEWYSFSTIKSEVQKQIGINRSLLLYKKTQQGIERFFVVWW